MLENIYDNESEGHFQKGYTPPDIQLINQLDELIETHFKTHKDAEFYCELLRITERRMNAYLKFHRNVTVFQLIRTRVFKEADSLLLRTAMSIQEISYELGIADPGYFSRIFKEVKGLTPKEYRCFNIKEETTVF